MANWTRPNANQSATQAAELHGGDKTAIDEAADCVLIHIEIRRSRRDIEQRFAFELALTPANESQSVRTAAVSRDRSLHAYFTRERRSAAGTSRATPWPINAKRRTGYDSGPIGRLKTGGGGLEDGGQGSGLSVATRNG